MDGVVAVGGDGSYHGLLAPLRGSNVPLGLIPLGTANDLATGNGVPLTIEEACQVIRVGATRQVDLVVVRADRSRLLSGCHGSTGIGWLGSMALRRRSYFHRYGLPLGGANLVGWPLAESAANAINQ